jgi:hypothetical protein
MPIQTHLPLYHRRQLASASGKKSLKSDNQIATFQEKRNNLMRQIGKWRELQRVYMPGAIVTPRPSEDTAEGNDAEFAETVPLILPSSLDHEQQKRICLQQVAEHERLLRMARLQDSLIELRHTRKIRHKLLLNHHVQVAGQGQRANTRSRAVLNSVEDRIAKFVERYRVAYRALLQLDATGDWKETFLELKDGDNRGPGKERDEEHAGDGSYFRSWIWLPNPRAPDVNGSEEGEEGASDEDVNEVIRVEWTTSFARLERWTEEVDLLQEEMRRVVMFLEWKSADWLARADVCGENLALDIQSGLIAYAKKQASIYHNLAVSFAKLWRPTLVSYELEHSWVTEYMEKHGISLLDTNSSVSRGIFRFRLSGKACDTISPSTSAPSKPPEAAETISADTLLEEATYSDDSGSIDSSFDLESDWDDDDPDF